MPTAKLCLNQPRWLIVLLLKDTFRKNSPGQLSDQSLVTVVSWSTSSEIGFDRLFSKTECVHSPQNSIKRDMGTAR